jgi:hypothetical protein
VLGSPRHHEHISGSERHPPLGSIGLAERDVELAVEGQEELVGVVVDVPHVLAPGMRDPHVVVVDPGHDPGAVDLVERGERLVQVHGLVHGYQAASCPRQRLVRS